MLQQNFIHREFQSVFTPSFQLVTIKAERFLAFQNRDNSFTFLNIPSAISLKKEKSFLFFKCFSLDKNYYKSFLNFQRLLSYFFSIYNKKFKKTLLVKGLGMRISYLKKKNLLELKLGFSNLLLVSVPLSLKVFKSKNLITFEGYNAAFVGNFAYLVQSLRYPDSYKGKGLWFKSVIYKLKLIKKT